MLARLTVAGLLVISIMASAARADAVDDVIRGLRSGDKDAQLEAFAGLMRLSRDPGIGRAAPAVLECVDSKHAEVRSRAIMNVSSFVLGNDIAPEDGKRAAESLLKDRDGHVRQMALRTFRIIATTLGTETEIVPAFVEALADPHWRLRLEAATQLLFTKLDPLPEPLIAPLAKALAAKDRKLARSDPELVADVRRYASEVLIRAGAKGGPAVAALTRALGDESPKVRLNCVLALEGIGEPARKAEPMLAKLLTDAEESVRTAAVNTLATLGPRKAESIRGLTRVLEKGDEKTRVAAARGLAKAGADAKPAVAALTRALEDGDPDLREAAARALGAIGSAARSAVSRLEKLAEQDIFERVKEAAAEALAKIRAE